MILDDHLRGTQDMPGRHQPHADIADFQRFSIVERLELRTRPSPQPEFHDGDRIGGGQHCLVAGPCVIGMAMGDNGARHRLVRIDVKIARHAV